MNPQGAIILIVVAVLLGWLAIHVRRLNRQARNSPEYGRTTGSSCANCGASVAARFCPECGQERQRLFPTTASWLSRSLRDWLDLDGRLPQTIRRLYWPPGELTLEWWRGRRQPYTTPLRLYLVTSLLFFLGWERTPFAAFIRGVVSGALDAGGLTAADRERVYAMFVEWLPATMIILAVPLAAALLYIANRAQGLFAGNLVLALHMYSAWFLAFALYALLDAAIAPALPLGWLLFPMLMLWLCVCALIAEKRVFEIGWMPAIVRSVAVGIVYLAILSMLFGLAFTLTANVALPR